MTTGHFVERLSTHISNCLTMLDTHAGAIQALCAILALITAIVVAVLLLKSLEATRVQARISGVQSRISSDQFSLGMRQYQDSVRPIIVVSVLQSLDNTFELNLRNDGNGPALGMNGGYTQRTNILGSNSSCQVTLLKDETNQFVFRYSSLDKRYFETVVNIYSDSNCLHQYRELPIDAERI
jgi:hypothetical protein